MESVANNVQGKTRYATKRLDKAPKRKSVFAFKGAKEVKSHDKGKNVKSN